MGQARGLTAIPEVEDPVHDSEHESEEERGPEVDDVESGDELGCKQNEERIDDEREESECDDIYRESENHENRADKEIQRAEHDGGDERADEGYRDARNDVCGDADGERGDKPMEKYFHMQELYHGYRGYYSSKRRSAITAIPASIENNCSTDRHVSDSFWSSGIKSDIAT